MIYTLTPNPALDLGGVVDRLIPNEKAYVHDETRFPGGNGINAARIIHKMGWPVIAGGFLGGAIGQEINQLLMREKVRCEFIPIQENTRISVTVSHRKTHLQTRLSFAGPQIRSREVRDLELWVRKIVPPALLVVGGSLPQGFSVLNLKRIMNLLRDRDVPTILDVPAHFLKKLISCRPLLIKPNRVEFEELIGKRVSSVSELIVKARKLNSKIKWVCVSSVAGGALLVTQDQVWFGKTPGLSVRTTVGAGDSMVGAMTAYLAQGGGSGAELLRWGLAAASATLITPGTKLGDYRHIKAFYKQIKVKEIKKF